MGFLKHFRACADDCPDCKASPCDTCCPGFTITYRQRSASKTKCGFDEFGTPSTPPKRYLIKTQSGGLTDSVYLSGYTYTNAWSGAVTFSRPGCTSSDTRQLDVAVSGTCSANITVTGLGGQIDGGAGPNGLSMWDVDCSGTTAIPIYGCSGPTVVSTTVQEFASPPCGAAGAGGSTVTLTLSSEYTTSDLFSDTFNALIVGGWSSYSGGSSTAFYSVSSDELTITLREFGFKATFDTAVPTGCKFEWDVFLNGGFYAHVCVNLTPGSSEYTDDLPVPPFPGEEYTVGNFAITSGSC